MKFNGRLILCFSIAIISLGYGNSTIPTKDSFIAIEPYALTLFKLNGNTKLSEDAEMEIPTEAYFIFDNQYTTGDVVFTFAKGLSYSTHVYVYPSYSTIQKDEKGQYIGAILDQRISLKEIIIKKADTPSLPKGKLYIIIKDVIDYYYDDYMTVFHEADRIPIEVNSSITINKAYSTMKRYITIPVDAKEKVKVHLLPLTGDSVSEVKGGKESEPLVPITKGTDGYKTTIKTTARAESYIIEITYAADTAYQLKKIYLTTNSEVRECLELKENITKEITLLTGINKHYFYVPLESLIINEEGSLTAYFDYRIIKEKQLTKFSSKVINLDSVDNDALLKEYYPKPGDDSDFAFASFNNMDTMYQMFFYKTIEGNVIQKPYLLVYIEITLTNPQLTKFSLALSPRIIDIDITIKELVSFEIDLENNIPQYYKIKVEEAFSPTINYILYSTRDIQKIYHDSFFSSRTQPSVINTTKVYKNQLYLFPITLIGENRPGYLIIQLFGDKETITFTFEKTKMEIISANTQSTQTMIKYFSLSDCKNPSYILGNYKDVTSAYFYYSTMMGQFDIYLKQMQPNEEQSKGLLPNKNNLLTEKSAGGQLITQHNIIIGFKCYSPGALKLQSLVYNIPTSIAKNEKVTFLLPANAKHRLPLEEQYDKDFGIAIYSPDPEGVVITINCDNEKITVDLASFKGDWKNVVPMTMKSMILTSTKKTFITITLEVISAYEIALVSEIAITENNKPNYLFKIDRNHLFASLNMSLSNVNSEGFYFNLIGGKPSFISLLSPIEDQLYQPNEERTWSITIPNPYESYHSNPLKEDEDYYIALSFITTTPISNSILFKFNPKETGVKIPSHNWQKFTLETRYFLESSNDLKSKLLILINSKSTNLRRIQLMSNFQTEPIETFSVGQENKIFSFHANNYGIETHLIGLSTPFVPSTRRLQNNDNDIQITYTYATEEQIVNYDDVTIPLNYDTNTHLLYWENPNNLDWTYKVYLAKKEDVVESFDDYNYVITFKPYEKLITLEAQKRSVKLDFEDKTEYVVNIVAIVSNPLHMETSMKAIEVIGDPENANLLALWIILGLIGLGVIVGFIVFFVIKKKTENGSRILVNIKSQNQHQTNVGYAMSQQDYKSIKHNC